MRKSAADLNGFTRRPHRAMGLTMTPRDRALLYSPPLAALLFFAAAYVVGRWHDHAVDRGVRLLDRLRL